ncbi:MAG: glycine cleavage system aminomethyltransferase GcvT [Alphaproteobacteria bacterium]|nr:glycine cleavage system aminomethyltransferase GcvT [Alphaproteobacteria bacterium]
MAAFAGYDMPIHYPLGVLGEHKQVRQAAGLFDVSHMGQARLVAKHKGASVSALFERLTPAAIATLKPNHMRYGLLTNEAGGIIDDLMISHIDNGLWLVINAADKQANFSYLGEQLADKAVLEIADRALLALQGPQAADILAQIFPEAAHMRFMQTAYVVWQGAPVLLSRCGYTGEDGFEISLPAEQGEDFARFLLAQQGVAPIGLGARDSLRLEAGLCLYGQDIDATTTPLEADLLWTIGKHRLQAGDFLGADIIKAQCATGAPRRRRVGIAPQTRAPARTGTQIENTKNEPIGQVTSGGFAPSLNAPIAMGYVASDYAALDTEVNLLVRGNLLPAKITALPFVPHNYYRSPKT